MRQRIHFLSVATKDGKALVLFEDGKDEIEKVARAIAERLEAQGREVLVQAASRVGISDILASSLYLLGAESARSQAYAELERVFKGINLAGRQVAFFGASGAAVAWLRGLCADTEASAAHSDLVGRGEGVAAWLKGVLSGAKG
jgi:hypothetical protein